jgi:DMSO/TMAO reductase YedYZ heme-binding membrane subunit
MLGTLTWYVTRASGVIAYVLLAAATFWGLALSTKVHGKKPPRPWMLDVHRMLGGLALVLTVVHVVAILLDGFVDFGPVDVLVPFAISWKPLAVGAGVIGMYLLVAVEVTSLLRQRISNRTWRRVHYLSFVVFVLSSLHFVTAGTDAKSPVTVAIVLSAVLAVVALTGYRIHKVVRATTPAPSLEPSLARPARPKVFRSSDGAVVPPPPPRRARATRQVPGTS